MALVHDLYLLNDAFNLSTRVGSDALRDISKPLEHIWDGTIKGYPLLVALRLRANEGYWNRARPTGIFNMNVNGLVTKYHSLTTADVEAVRLTRLEPRAIQNAKGVFLMSQRFYYHWSKNDHILPTCQRS